MNSSIPIEQFDGDMAVGRDITIGGNSAIRGSAKIGHNLIVNGWIEAKNIKAANKGLFKTEEQLRDAYPTPEKGWWALVAVQGSEATDHLGQLYISDGKKWVAQVDSRENPLLKGVPTIENKVYTETVERLTATLTTINGDVRNNKDEIKDLRNTQASDTANLNALYTRLENTTTDEFRSAKEMLDTLSFELRDLYRHTSKMKNSFLSFLANSPYNAVKIDDCNLRFEVTNKAPTQTLCLFSVTICAIHEVVNPIHVYVSARIADEVAFSTSAGAAFAPSNLIKGCRWNSTNGYYVFSITPKDVAAYKERAKKEEGDILLVFMTQYPLLQQNYAGQICDLFVSPITLSQPDFSRGKILSVHGAELASAMENLGHQLFDISNKQSSNLPIGVADNYGQYVLSDLACRTINTDTSLSLRYGLTEKDQDGRYTKIDIHLRNQTTVLRLKRQDATLWITNQSGAFFYDKISDLDLGREIFQRLGNGLYTTFKFGYVADISTDYVTVYLEGQNRIVIELSEHNNKNNKLPFEIDERHFGVFKTNDIPEGGLDVRQIYASRAEKLNSQVFGKRIILFSDSLAPFSKYLLEDWGMDVYCIASGGHRMGFEPGSGAGGEQGTAESLWLCKDTSIQYVKSILPDHVDFIVNMSGTNGSFSDISSPEEVEFCYNNKRWYDHNLATDPWGELSIEDKRRFTSPACYIVAFYSLGQIYPTAQAVVVEPYLSFASRSDFENGKWKDIRSFSTKMYGRPASTFEEGKSRNLRMIAEKLGAIFIPNNVVCGQLNAPSLIADSVHPGAEGKSSKAATIAKYLSFPPVNTSFE